MIAFFSGRIGGGFAGAGAATGSATGFKAWKCAKTTKQIVAKIMPSMHDWMEHLLLRWRIAATRCGARGDVLDASCGVDRAVADPRLCKPHLSNQASRERARRLRPSTMTVLTFKLAAAVCLGLTASFAPPSLPRHRRYAPVLQAKSQTTSKKMVVPIDGDEAFLAAMQYCTDDRLVAVKFYASWCRACKSIAPRFERLAKEFAGDEVQFFEIEFAANKELCRRLNIKKLPCVQYFRGSLGCVDTVMCGPSKFPDVRVKLEELLVETRDHVVKPYELRDTIRAVAVKQGKFADDESAMEQFIEVALSEIDANHDGVITVDEVEQWFDAHAVADVAPTNATLPEFTDVRELYDGALPAQ